MSRAKGFSLVEVLLATSLLAAGMALAFLTLRNAGMATEKARVEAAQSERLRAVQSFLRRQLSTALPLPIEFDPASGEAWLFDASAHELRFVSAMPGYLSRGGPHVQTLSLARDRDGMRLQFQHQLLTPDGPIDAERPPEVLLRGIAEGGFELRTLAPDGQPAPWQTEWTQRSQLPQMVRLRLRMQSPRESFPDLVVALKLGAGYGPSVLGNGPPDAGGNDQ